MGISLFWNDDAQVGGGKSLVVNVPWNEFDLSALTYPQFLAFFFDRPIAGDEECYDLFRSGIDCFIASNPGTVVAHVQTMCQRFAELAAIPLNNCATASSRDILASKR